MRSLGTTTRAWAALCPVDPLAGHITDPQTLNKYTYVRNNPVNEIDPDGRDGTCILGVCYGNSFPPPDDSPGAGALGWGGLDCLGCTPVGGSQHLTPYRLLYEPEVLPPFHLNLV